MGRLGAPEIIFIILVVILLFGVKKLPEIGSSLGKAIREFKKAGKELGDDVKEVTRDQDNERKS